MAAGIAIGIAAPDVASRLSPVSNIFLRLIRSIIAPLIFGTLVYGIAGSGDLKQMGRIGLKAIVYFEAVTTVALFLGLGAVNLVRPGAGMKLAPGPRRDRRPAEPTGARYGHRARISRQHHRRHGARRRARDRGVLVYIRRGLRGYRRESQTSGRRFANRWPR